MRSKLLWPQSRSHTRACTRGGGGGPARAGAARRGQERRISRAPAFVSPAALAGDQCLHACIHAGLLVIRDRLGTNLVEAHDPVQCGDELSE